jgi:hypothetical protein
MENVLKDPVFPPNTQKTYLCQISHIATGRNKAAE